MSIEGATEDLEPRAPERRVRRTLIALAIAFVTGAIVALVLNSVLSGPSLEVLEAPFEAVTADLDSIAVQGEDEKYDLTHAAGVECLQDVEPGEVVSLGITNVDLGDADVPFVAEIGQDRVVLWVECLGFERGGTDL